MRSEARSTLDLEVQQSLTRVMQRIGSAGTSAAADRRPNRQPPRQLRRSLILVR